jgi:tRNA pseudouridine13 synthase
VLRERVVKIKVRPEDFVVQEEPAVRLGEHPDRYAVFRLAKREWDTFDLLDLLARRLGVRSADISVGGFKDRFGSTEQLVSVRIPPGGRPKAWERGLREKNFTLELAGYGPDPVTARSIRGNAFTITLRDLDPTLLPRYRERAEGLRRWGLPNYYDEQRFGSARHGKGFMGKELFLGHRERALRLYFEPSRHDDRRSRALKSRVIEAWGHWERCLESAFGEYRRVLEYLREHPRAWRQALLRIDRRFLLFVLNAYQSYLFNELLTARLVELAGASRATTASPATMPPAGPWRRCWGGRASRFRTCGCASCRGSPSTASNGRCCSCPGSSGCRMRRRTSCTRGR